MISPWQQYDTQPSWKFPLLLDSRPLIVTGLAPSNFQLILHPTNGGQEIIGKGPFSDLVTSDPEFAGSPPSIIYHEHRDDVSIIGEYRAWLLITYNDGSQETLKLGYIEIQGR
jgi:hypothetical protein